MELDEGCPWHGRLARRAMAMPSPGGPADWSCGRLTLPPVRCSHQHADRTAPLSQMKGTQTCTVNSRFGKHVHRSQPSNSAMEEVTRYRARAGTHSSCPSGGTRATERFSPRAVHRPPASARTRTPAQEAIDQCRTIAHHRYHLHGLSLAACADHENGPHCSTESARRGIGFGSDIDTTFSRCRHTQITFW